MSTFSGSLRFLFEKGLFALNAPAVAAQFAVTRNDAMTRDQYRDPVLSTGLCNRTDLFLVAKSLGDLSIAARLTIRYFSQEFPHLHLKRRRP